METKKLAGIFALLTIALGMAGYAYATWYKYLYIEGQVNTGTLDVEWSIENARDTEPSNKDYSHIEGEIEGDTLYVTVYNAYPCIDYYLDINIHNSGTIPVHVYFGEMYGSLFGYGTVEVVGLPVGNFIQIHPGEYWYGTIHVHLEQNADMGATYYFYMDNYVVQWNEPERPGYVAPTHT
jgi:hypothetical protein